MQKICHDKYINTVSLFGWTFWSLFLRIVACHVVFCVPDFLHKIGLNLTTNCHSCNPLRDFRMEKNSTNKTDKFKIHPGRSVLIKEAYLTGWLLVHLWLKNYFRQKSIHLVNEIFLVNQELHTHNLNRDQNRVILRQGFEIAVPIGILDL